MADTRTKPWSAAGRAYLEALTHWLQDTRLMSEAVFRLYRDYQTSGRVEFSKNSWPKPVRSETPLRDFIIAPTDLAARMDHLLKTAWAERFVFLETLWEEYLEELVKELRHKDSALFEPFVDKEFMSDIVREVITDRLTNTVEIKDEVASRFASGLTRQPWESQWKQLRRLEIGLTATDSELPWFAKLDLYFEMRNCIIHRQGRVSPLLRRKGDKYFSRPDVASVEIWPPHLDYFRHQFISCVLHIEGKLAARFGAPAA